MDCKPEDLDKVFSIYEKLTKDQKAQSAAFMGMATIRRRQKDLDGAIRFASMAYAHNCDGSSIDKAHILSFIGLRYYDKCFLDRNDKNPLEIAKGFFNRSHQHAPTIINFSRWGRLLANIENNYDAAYQKWDQAIDMQPIHFKPVEKEAFYEICCHLAVYWSIKRDYKKSIDFSRKAKQLIPTFNWAFETRATALFFSGQIDKSEKYCKRSLDINPNDPKSLDLKSRILWNKERYEEAIEVYEKLMKLGSPDQIERYKGLMKKCQQKLNQATNKQPRNISANTGRKPWDK